MPSPKRGRGPRLTPPRKQHKKKAESSPSEPPLPPLTDGDVTWAAVQVDVAVDRLKDAEQAMLRAHDELAARRLLATRMAEAKVLGTTAAQMAEVHEQRKHEATVASERAAQAAQREREAGVSLEDTRARERDAMEEVSALQRSLSLGSDVAA
jgi:hypothetical protein